jgi:crotonobetainyl-CoA:carnitine CoA-transferase CaiB-like acyl-CoA transferase
VNADRIAEPWSAVDVWAEQRPIEEALERCRLLGLAAGVVPHAPAPEEPLIATRLAEPGRAVEVLPLVACLAGLWAGPLAARLLRLEGAVVIFVESRTRRDPVRVSSPKFFSRLRAGSSTVVLDLPRQVPELLMLLGRADVVIEGSRPRALAQWGVDPGVILAESATTWVSITGHGREEGDRVGFGNDAAMAGGQVVWSPDGTPWPVGDALADPLAGLWAATAALDGVRSGGGVLIDVALRRVASAASGAQNPVEAPQAPPPRTWL